MAPPKKKNVGRTASYYRSNPEARKKKAETDKKINARPEQRKKRSELSTKNRQADKRGINRKGKDAAHQKDGSIRYVDSSKNRGNKTTTAGDRRSRAKKK